MKTPLLLLVMVATLAAPDSVKSKKVEIDLTQDARITLQSVQEGQDYHLLLELTSTAFELSQADPCQVFLTVDREPVTLPCRVTLSTEVISPSRHTDYITEYVTVSGSEQLVKALDARSVKIKVGHYDIELGVEDLKQLKRAFLSL